MQSGLVVDGTGFEVLAGDQRIGSRRVIAEADVALLTELAQRYVRAVQANSDASVFLEIGRELYRWLDGDQRQLSALLDRAAHPLVFEVQGPREPNDKAWAVLRAPFELLAPPDGGLLAEDTLTRFCVVRRMGPAAEPPKLGPFRLGLAFMASSPRGQHELDYEAEEAAILSAIGEARVDLLVEDTGDPGQLGQRLADSGGLPVVHLSCHGLNNYRQKPSAPPAPVLMMEDEEGNGLPTTAGKLVSLLPGGPDAPRLVFVSACLSATGANDAGHLPPGDRHKGGGGPDGGSGGLVAHSLATALVAAGVPAVIAWDGSVGDRAATVFAQHLYQDIAKRTSLPVAVGDARRTLLSSDDPHVRADWHLARLWLGPLGGGPLVAGNRKRSLVTATHGTKTFLDRKQQVPVATAEMFVGRRPELQQSLRALRSGERAGVLLHGQGRLGKSSLAARIADRLADRYAVAVVFGDYGALGILDAVAAAVDTNAAARRLVEERLPEVRQQPETIRGVLLDLLTGPCAQAGPDGQKPLLLIIDDLEQILQASPDGPHRVTSDYAEVLAAVLRAFDPEGESRLLLTSRFTFTLDGLERRLEPVQLRPLSDVGQDKLFRRQQSVTPEARRNERSELAARALAVSRGNPGLQDLIVARLVYGEQVSLDRAEAAVSGMEEYLRRGDLPADAEVRAFLENLALDALLDEAGPSNVDLLRASTLFDLPVPESVIDLLAESVGGSVTRLRGLGLLVPYQDLHDPARLALAPDPLATGRLDPLSDDERSALAALAVAPLFAAWGGATGGPNRTYELDLQLTLLALLGDDPTVAAACAAHAVQALRSGPAADALAVGRDAINLLDQHGRAVPIGLLRRAADAAITSGDGETGDALLDRTVGQAESQMADNGTDSPDRARVIAERGVRLITRGDLEQASHLLHQAHQLFTDAGSDGEAASVMGMIAEIAYQRGDYDEALHIHRDICLPTLQRLGDTRETAITWGQIADIAFERGDYDEALRIRREISLPTYQRLGDTLSTAVTWAKIADIAYQRGDYDEALRIRREMSLPTYQRLGDTRSIAVTWGKIADIAYRRGDHDEALRIHREIRFPAFQRLGDTKAIALTWTYIADINFERGDYDEAVRIHHDICLPTYQRLGDTRSTAATWSKIADIAYERGEYGNAANLRQKALDAFEQVGDLDGVANANWGLAKINLSQEDYESAAPRLVESFQINRHLQRPDGVAIVGTELGRLLLAVGQRDDARWVLTESLAAATKIGRADAINRINALLKSIDSEEGT